MRAILALADGLTFEGEAFGAEGESVGEVVFNTSLTGYQEILTDPSYVGQIVCMTCPEMGNVGANDEDQESVRPHAVGMIARHVAREASNWRSQITLDGYLKRHQLPGIMGIDTRQLVRHLRTVGAQMGVLATGNLSASAAVGRARSAPGMEGRDLATGVSCKQPFAFAEATGDPLHEGGKPALPTRYHVVAYDYGLKRMMLKLLVAQGCRVTVVPAWTPALETLALKPDGVFLTNGPGDPAAVKGADRIVSDLFGKVPLFGICLGHQIMGLAAGAKTYKLKFGHRGANQPVNDLATGKVEITCQNHGFAVDAPSLGSRAKVTHVNLNDGTVEGIALSDVPAFSVQYHPEASPGPHDARYLFNRFLVSMQTWREGGRAS
jgi:carbamoyl-phosphate synthase small subunit